MKYPKKTVFFLFLLITVFFSTSLMLAQTKKALEIKDIMAFKKISESYILSNANLVAYVAKPDRGNTELFVKRLKDNREYVFEKASNVKISQSENWILAKNNIDFKYTDIKVKDKPKVGAFIFNVSIGDTVMYNNVKSYDIANSDWFYIHFEQNEKEKTKNAKYKSLSGSKLLLANLSLKQESKYDFVTDISFDSLGNKFALSIVDTAGNNKLIIINISNGKINETKIDEGNYLYKNLLWNNKGKLVYTKSQIFETGKADTAEVFIYDNQTKKTSKIADKKDRDFYTPTKNRMQWTKNGERVFFGRNMIFTKAEINKGDSTDIYNQDFILNKNTLDVWHNNDPLIKTQEKKEYKRRLENLYFVVYDTKINKLIPLADANLRNVEFSNSNSAIGYNDLPYLKEIVYDGYYNDVFVVNTNTGNRLKILERYQGRVTLSPNGNYVAYFKDNHWFIFDINKQIEYNLTSGIKTAFHNEEHDTPDSPSAYGFAGWGENDKFLMVYDKYDIYQFNTDTKAFKVVTNNFGRKNDLQLRIVNRNRDKVSFSENERVLLTAYNTDKKYRNIYSLVLKTNEITKIGEDNKNYNLLSESELSKDYLFTRETYNEYPDLHFMDKNYKNLKKISSLGKQTEKYLWGKSELIEWTSIDGERLQGVVIKPDNYDPKKKYPVLVYYYEISSNRLYNFPDVVINHRPNFPYYSGNDYVIFLPDIKFTIGYPGQSAVKALVPGVQKLVDLGIADPKAIGLHGHSWSGYQTAYVVTQTDIFACAITGAPVSNMTSAYGGIRWGTGMARLFQYEKTQSRIGGTLWEKPLRYIENSPIFYADRINTPVLIQHGDEDEAVPWYQAIELYLAMRRLNKDCIFLQYRGELHHLQKYANKLDYTIKMMEYLDHYLKKKPAADWIKNGIPINE